MRSGGCRRAGSPGSADACRFGSCRAGGGDPAALVAELKEVGAWLEEFHPQSLVELDYGGLVHLLDDGALCADQSVAEVSAAISAVAAGEMEFAAAMHERFADRWRALDALKQAN